MDGTEVAIVKIYTAREPVVNTDSKDATIIGIAGGNMPPVHLILDDAGPQQQLCQLFLQPRSQPAGNRSDIQVLTVR